MSDRWPFVKAVRVDIDDATYAVDFTSDGEAPLCMIDGLEQKDKAEELVRRWNNYARLLAAAQAVRGQWSVPQTGGEYTTRFFKTVDDLSRLVAELEGEK